MKRYRSIYTTALLRAGLFSVKRRVKRPYERMSYKNNSPSLSFTPCLSERISVLRIKKERRGRQRMVYVLTDLIWSSGHRWSFSSLEAPTPAHLLSH